MKEIRVMDQYTKFTATCLTENLVEEELRFQVKTYEPCGFGSDAFLSVMDNLMRNPNLTSSNLFRADILWDSEKDAGYASARRPSSTNSPLWSLDCGYPLQSGVCEEMSPFIKHMKANLRPRNLRIEGYQLKRCLVRELVPRNENRDSRLAQTVSFWRREAQASELSVSKRRRQEHQDHNTASDCCRPATNEDIEEDLVVCLPHASSPDLIPYYHPKVRAITFSFTGNSTFESAASLMQDDTRDKHFISKADAVCASIVSIQVCEFERSSQSTKKEIAAHEEATDRLQKTLKNLSRIICKHGRSTQLGYKKRMHHDKIIPQSRLQDTYALLKSKYANWLLHECWKEQTDATKGIFEDLGIAAFLIELWKDMYPASQLSSACAEGSLRNTPFPGFVDIACGNGVLVCVLACEGYKGFGFDARSRKTWTSFPKEIQQRLVKGVLIPAVLQTALDMENKNYAMEGTRFRAHNGIFTEQNDGFPQLTQPPFIISNHADELTLWTPLIAHMNDHCPFLAIPCCSHDLSGAKTRFTDKPYIIGGEGDCHEVMTVGGSDDCRPSPKGQVSAYQGLCNALIRLSHEVGYSVESEWLRIPSTRNFGVVGRVPYVGNKPSHIERIEFLKCKLEKETHGKDIELVRSDFLERIKTIINVPSGY